MEPLVLIPSGLRGGECVKLCMCFAVINLTISPPLSNQQRTNTRPSSPSLWTSIHHPPHTTHPNHTRSRSICQNQTPPRHQGRNPPDQNRQKVLHRIHQTTPPIRYRYPKPRRIPPNDPRTTGQSLPQHYSCGDETPSTHECT